MHKLLGMSLNSCGSFGFSRRTLLHGVN